MIHVVLVTIGSGGDIYPFIRIGQVMIEEGYKVTLVTHGVYEEKAKRLGFSFVGTDAIEEYNFLMSPEVHAEIQEPKGAIEFTKTNMLPKIENSFHRIIEELHDPTILVGHNMLHGLVQVISEKLCIPYVSVFLAPGYLEGEEMGANLDIYSKEYNSIRESVGLQPVINWGGMVKCYSQGIAFWPDWFAKQEGGLATNITSAGFLLHENDEEIVEEVQAWLIEKRPIVITHGTTPPSSSSYFESCIEACDYLNFPALVVTKDQKFLPRNLPDNVKHIDFLPFSRAMPYISVLIHHGGIGTTGQALRSGTPQLILGKGFDRPRNAECVKSLGAGAYLPASKWDMHNVVETLRNLIQQEDLKQNCLDISTRFIDNDPDLSVKDVVRKLVANPCLPDWSQMFRLDKNEPVIYNDKLSLIKGLSLETRQLLLSKLRNT
ncbi:glycosyltransferase [Paenibacillus sp. Marseille-Q9583]